MKNWQEELLSILKDKGCSDFQVSVYRVVLEIPRGRTLAYADIAQKTGNARSARAVARALAANPLPLIIPCHRVIRKNGSCGGYKWGEKLKKRLLSLEGTPFATR